MLRALDTVEDDVSIPADAKSTMLKNFHTYLLDPNWKYMESTEKDKIVLEDFPTVSFPFLLYLCWCFFCVRIDPIYLLAGCFKKQVIRS